MKIEYRYSIHQYLLITTRMLDYILKLPLIQRRRIIGMYEKGKKEDAFYKILHATFDQYEVRPCVKLRSNLIIS